MSLLVRDGGPWTEGELTLALADYAAHALPAGPGGNVYFIPYLGLEFDAAFNDVPFRLGSQARPVTLGVLSVWCDGADEPAACAATFDVLVNGATVPGLTLTVNLGTFSGVGTANAFATPRLVLSLDDTVSVRVTVADPTTGVGLLLFARVSGIV